MPHREVASAIRTVRASDTKPVVALAFEFLVLTAARWGEVRWAEWGEIDRAEGVWAVPAARMKMRREHRVPLCGRAVEILEEARGLGGGGPLVFTVGDGKPMSKNRLRRRLQKLWMGAVPYGFRSSFRDWAAEETDHRLSTMVLHRRNGMTHSTLHMFSATSRLVCAVCYPVYS